jgi:hypothetical protein
MTIHNVMGSHDAVPQDTRRQHKTSITCSEAHIRFRVRIGWHAMCVMHPRHIRIMLAYLRLHFQSSQTLYLVGKHSISLRAEVHGGARNASTLTAGTYLDVETTHPHRPSGLPNSASAALRRCASPCGWHDSQHDSSVVKMYGQFTICPSD